MANVRAEVAIPSMSRRCPSVNDELPSFQIPVGLWLGDTENATVVTDLLADLQARGLSAECGLLVVIDGAKALAAGVRRVFGDHALVQRCTLHKRRNVGSYLPTELADRIDRRLAQAFNHLDPANRIARAKAIASELDRDHPDAAASLREGLEDMSTVPGWGCPGVWPATARSAGIRTLPVSQHSRQTGQGCGRMRRN